MKISKIFIFEFQHFFVFQRTEDIKTHKMSWDNLALKESNGLHFAPSSGSGILGGS